MEKLSYPCVWSEVWNILDDKLLYRRTSSIKIYFNFMFIFNTAKVLIYNVQHL